MSVTLTGTGGLFPRIATLISAIRNVNGFRGTGSVDTIAGWASGEEIVELQTLVNNIQDQYEASDSARLIDSLYSYRDNYRTAHSTFVTALQTIARNTVIQMVNDDHPLPSPTLQNALTELIRQMTAGSATVTKNTVSVTATPYGSNAGDAEMVVSVVGNNGVNQEYVFAENIIATVTNDKNISATAGSEPLSFAAPAAKTDTLAYDWPGGSGASGTLTVIDPARDGISTNNMLVNGSFDVFTETDIPDNWAIVVGTASTDINENNSTTYGSSDASLEFAGDGSTLSEVAQTFNSSSGTTLTLQPLTTYQFCCRVKISAANGAGTGELTIRLVNGSNVTIMDATGTDNEIVYDLKIASTAWIAVKGTFRTPANMPTTVKLSIGLSEAMTTAKSVYIDHAAFAKATQLYTGGPFVSLFRGATDVLKADYWTIAVANNKAGVNQTMWDRLFGLRTLGLQLPSASSGSITDVAAQTLFERYGVVGTVDPQTVANTQQLTDAIDMQAWDQVIFIALLGDMAAETIDFKLQESATSGGSYTDIAGKTATQLAAHASNNDNKQIQINLRATDLSGGMRYVKGRVITGGATGGPAAVLAIGVNPVSGNGTSLDLASVAQVLT